MQAKSPLLLICLHLCGLATQQRKEQALERKQHAQQPKQCSRRCSCQEDQPVQDAQGWQQQCPNKAAVASVAGTEVATTHRRAGLLPPHDITARLCRCDKRNTAAVLELGFHTPNAAVEYQDIVEYRNQWLLGQVNMTLLCAGTHAECS